MYATTSSGHCFKSASVKVGVEPSQNSDLPPAQRCCGTSVEALLRAGKERTDCWMSKNALLLLCTCSSSRYGPASKTRMRGLSSARIFHAVCKILAIEKSLLAQ